jgi:hypothetical protein
MPPEPGYPVTIGFVRMVYSLSNVVASKQCICNLLHLIIHTSIRQKKKGSWKIHEQIYLS